MNVKKIKLLNRTISCFIFAISVFIVFSMIYLTYYSTCWGDDIYFSQYVVNENIFSCLTEKRFLSNHGGGYLGLFLGKIFSFGVPNILGIHPADFMGKYHGFIKGIFCIFTLFSLANLSKLVNKSKLINFLCFSFLTFFFFYSAFITRSWVAYISYNYYRYFISLFFIGIFLHFIFSNLLKKEEKINKKKIIVASLSAFIVGTSVEINFFMLLTLFFSVIFYNIILNTFSIKIEKLKYLKDYKFNLDWNFYVPNIFLAIAVLLFTSSDGFRNVALERGMGNIHITVDILKEFSCYFFKYCISENWHLWIVGIILYLLGTFVAKKRNELKLIFLNLIYHFALHLVMFSLILCGKTCTMTWNTNEMTYFISHVNVLFLYKMLLVIPFIILFAYITKKINFKMQFTITIICLMLILIASKFLYHIYLKDHNMTDFLRMKKTELYCAEKILRFYYLKGETPIVPMHMNEWFWCSKDIMYVNNSEMTAYYANIYNYNSANKIGFRREPNAMEKFYKKGGVISQKEIEELKFSKLKDSEFIFTQERDANDKILSPQEIMDVIKKKDYYSD